jgi:hypothetical protein
MIASLKSFSKNFVESFPGHVNATRQRDAGVHEDVQRSWSFGTSKFLMFWMVMKLLIF